MQTEIAVKKIFLCGENNRSKLSRFRNKFIQSARVNMNEAAFAEHHDRNGTRVDGRNTELRCEASAARMIADGADI
jgi:hypothetical protein